MTCSHCEARVKQALEAVDGVTGATVSRQSGTAVVRLKRDVPVGTLTATVQAQDYPCRAAQDEPEQN